MTVLAAAQSAGIRLLGRKPGSLFATDVFGLELGELATEAAVAISKYYDWQKLKVLKTYPGDGATVAFNLPTDYARMPKKATLHSLLWRTRTFRQAKDEDEFLYLQDVALTATPGIWILLGGQMQIYPPMPVAETARHYYMSNKIVAVADGAAGTKAAFTLDTDAFVLPERLLTLALIWRWRSMKRLEYSEDMTNYEIALSEEVAADKGQRIIVVGRQHMPAGADIAYPGRLGP